MKLTKIALLISLYGLCSLVYADTQLDEDGLSAPLSTASALLEPNAGIANGLSDFQWFRVFPYVDKSYALASVGRLEEALVEVERARNIVPDHLPLVLHHVELLIANDTPQRAFETLQPYITDPQARRIYAALLGRSDRLAGLSAGQFFDQLEQLDEDMQAAFARAYLSEHGGALNNAQLVRVTEVISAEQVSTQLIDQVVEYLFRRGGTDEIVAVLEPICRRPAGHEQACNAYQRGQLIHALALSEQFSGIEYWLLSLQDEFDNALNMTVNRMIGAERTEELIELLSKIDDQRSLNQAWGLVLYQLAVDHRDVALALSLAERLPVDCLSHAELLIQDQQVEYANARLKQCNPERSEERHYLMLAQQIGDSELLERVSFSTQEAERSRVHLLVDHYRHDHQRGDLIRVLEAYGAKDTQLQRRLAQAYYQDGQTEQALVLSARNWREHSDLASLDDHTFILLSEQRYEDLAHIAVKESWGDRGEFLVNDAISERVSIGIERAHMNIHSDVLVDAAQQWPDRRLATQVSEVLLQRQDCESALRIRQQLSSRAAYHLDSYCLGTPGERLTALEQYSAEWGDDEWLRGAVLAHESSDYHKSLSYLDNLSSAVDRGIYKPLQLSALLALGQHDDAWAHWQALDDPLTEDEISIGVDIALRRNDRESVTAALRRVERSDDVRTILPLRLRLAEMDGDLEQQLSWLERLADENPEEPYYPLAQAFVLERLGGYGSAARKFDQVFAAYPETRNGDNLQQAAYTNAQARRERVARQQLRDVIDTGLTQGQQGTEILTHSQRFYRQVSSPFSASIAGWLGESTSVSQATGNDFQADYFLSTTLEYDLDYGRERRTNLTVFANLLSAGDSFFFDSNNLDLGIAWQPMAAHLTFVRLAARSSFDGEGTRLYVRGSTDLLAGYNEQKGWAENKRFVDHSLYLDWVFFPDEQTSSVYARYQPTFQLAGAQRSYFKVGAYPFIQYQWTNDTFDQQGLSDTRFGLGVTWRQPLGHSRYAGWRAFSELGLEWQHVIDSDIAGVSDDALLLRFAVFF
ncbi:MAG: hypothetical protein JJU03_01605 [Idiomarina sp.]|nr:hypothetical protein [Idiomarina sp.]